MEQILSDVLVACKFIKRALQIKNTIIMIISYNTAINRPLMESASWPLIPFTQIKQRNTKYPKSKNIRKRFCIVSDVCRQAATILQL